METLCTQILSLNEQIKSVQNTLKSLKGQKNDCEQRLDHLMMQQAVTDIQVDGHIFIRKDYSHKEPLTKEEKVEQIFEKLNTRNISIDRHDAADLLSFNSLYRPSSKIIVKK